MSLSKQARDWLIRIMLGKNAVPSGLSELNNYFRHHGSIKFHEEKQEDGTIVAVSENFLFGKIITTADTQAELDEKVKDAILTAFEVPSSYAKEAGIHRVDGQSEHKEYAFA